MEAVSCRPNLGDAVGNPRCNPVPVDKPWLSAALSAFGNSCRAQRLFAAMNFSAVETVAEGLFTANSRKPMTKCKVLDWLLMIQDTLNALCLTTCAFSFSFFFFYISCYCLFFFSCPAVTPRAQHKSVKTQLQTSCGFPSPSNPPKLREKVATCSYTPAANQLPRETADQLFKLQ